MQGGAAEPARMPLAWRNERTDLRSDVRAAPAAAAATAAGQGQVLCRAHVAA